MTTAALSEALKTDEKNRVRAGAAEAIGKLRAPMSAELLKLALKDEDGGVRRVAEESLSVLDQSGFDDDAESTATALPAEHAAADQSKLRSPNVHRRNPPAMTVGSIRLRLHSVISFNPLVFQIETLG